jgi:formylglycine-generating enzyme required for sulfatase activity
MLGNAGQWCQDWYSSTYYKTSPAMDPQGPRDSSLRVVRGGGWYLGSSNVRSGYRNMGEERYRINGIGFRLAMDLP